MVVQKLIVSYGSKIVMQFIHIAVSIIVARVVGPTVLGTVAFGLAFVSMFEFFGSLGIGAAHVKLVSEGQDLGECISTFSILKIGNTILFFAIVMSAFLFQKYVLSVPFESALHEYVILILLVSVTIKQLLQIAQTTFVAKTEQAKQSIPEFVRVLFFEILRVIIVLLGYKAVALAFGDLISTLLIIPVVLYLFKDYPRAKFNKKLAAKYFKIAVPVIFIGTSTSLIMYLDKVVLQYFAGSEQVGYYTAAYRIGGLVLMLAGSIGFLFFPLFSTAVSHGNMQYMKATTEKFERFSFLFIMPVVIFLSLYADVIVRVLLGSQYLPSVSIMAIINVAMFLMVLNNPYEKVITGMGFFKLASLLNFMNLVLFIILVYTLPNPKIFNFGAVGVAVAILISNLFIGILYRIFAKQRYPLLDLKMCLKYVVFGLVNFVGFYFIYSHLSKLYGTNFKMIFVPSYFAVTYLVLYLIGWLEKDDIGNLKELLNVKKVVRYIKREIKDKDTNRNRSE